MFEPLIDREYLPDRIPIRVAPHVENLWNDAWQDRLRPQPQTHTPRQSRGEQIYHYLTDKHHLTAAQAAGIIGNMQAESRLCSTSTNNHESAIGLCQWQGARKHHLQQFAADHHRSQTDWRLQVDFMIHELRTTESRAWSKLQHASTAQQAALVFDRYYERSSGHARYQRIANAANFYRQAAGSGDAWRRPPHSDLAIWTA